jgi:hypothetical protein
MWQTNKFIKAVLQKSIKTNEETHTYFKHKKKQNVQMNMLQFQT